MPNHKHHGPSAALWMMICCLLPILLIYVLAAAGILISPLLLLVLMLLCWVAMVSHLGGSRPARDETTTVAQSETPIDEGRGEVTFDSSGIFDDPHQRTFDSVRIVEGNLLADPEVALKSIQERLGEQEVTPLLQEGEYGRTRLIILPGKTEESAPDRRLWIHGLLFLATVATTTWAGALHQGVNLLQEPERIAVGLPYSLTLMLILGAHELGHYFAAKLHGVNVTLPFFIPVPFALGTFGAFISMKSLPSNRRALFDVAVAGPIAGLVFAIPALWIGLEQSHIVEAGSQQIVGIMHHGTEVGSSILFATIAKLALGDAISQGHQLQLHPLAFAGWLGLIVTALNLMPIGQLDGGRIADALFGVRRSATIGSVALFALLFLGLFVWSGLLMWALIAFLLAGSKGVASQNDLVPVRTGRFAIGILAFVILCLILIPVPHAFYESLGIHCPYL